ncbi:hypothetical protein CPB85DRAFT_1325215 [Mucidula mucida]|nr:hypothetical protein CPB85DRAFT_1325215 [Mucidula mucida]
MIAVSAHDSNFFAFLFPTFFRPETRTTTFQSARETAGGEEDVAHLRRAVLGGCYSRVNQTHVCGKYRTCNSAPITPISLAILSKCGTSYPYKKGVSLVCKSRGSTRAVNEDISERVPRHSSLKEMRMRIQAITGLAQGTSSKKECRCFV